MIKPGRSGVFLPRPISAALWKPRSPGGEDSAGGPPSAGRLSFFILRRGRGTEELAGMAAGEEAELSGPLGNRWEDFLPPPGGNPPRETAGEPSSKAGPPSKPRPPGKAGPASIAGGEEKPAALVGGGIGAAPLLSLPVQREGYFDFYGGFRRDFKNRGERRAFLGTVETGARKVIIAVEEPPGNGGAGSGGAEDGGPPGKAGLVRRGRIPDFLDPADYGAVCACGPEGMLRAVAERCRRAGVPCYVSLERRMACGVGACLGCSIAGAGGNRRCCVDGPIFPAAEVFFDQG